MKHNAADTLFLPVTRGDVCLPDGRVIFLNATRPAGELPDGMARRLDCEQPWRGEFLDLIAHNWNVAARLSYDDFGAALIVCSKHRRENEAMIARATQMCRRGAPILVAGDKLSGVKPLGKRVDGVVPISGQCDKHHAHVFWFGNPGEDVLYANAQAALSPLSDAEAAAGMFSADHVDPGSHLLSRITGHLWTGQVADFGCGWGYLSLHAAKNDAVTSIDLIDAHWPSLEAAKVNLEKISCRQTLKTQWLDLEQEAVSGRFDTVICNPPFHAGAATRRSLGERFIGAAARALASGGHLYLVANSGLHYEPVVDAHFRTRQDVARENGFKIIHAVAR